MYSPERDGSISVNNDRHEADAASRDISPDISSILLYMLMSNGFISNKKATLKTSFRRNFDYIIYLFFIYFLSFDIKIAYERNKVLRLFCLNLNLITEPQTAFKNVSTTLNISRVFHKNISIETHCIIVLVIVAV